MIGKTVSHYRVLEKLGGGGMGEVFKAEDTKRRSVAALKFLAPKFVRDQQAFRQFVENARTVSALGHPHICPTYEIGQSEGRYFVAMQFLEGETLKQRLARGRLGTAEVLRIGAQTADALNAAHAHGVIHRDIRPAKIFLTTAGHVKILDFGLGQLRPKRAAASIDDTSGEQMQAALDLVRYMSPEQGLGEEVDGRSDIFSLGVVLYQMATGTFPFTGETPKAAFNATVHELPVPPRERNPEIPEELEWIISTTLAKYRELGYQRAAELRDDLNRLRKEKDTVFSQPFAVRVETEVAANGPAKSFDFTVAREGEGKATLPPKKSVDWRMVSALVGVFLLVSVASFFYWRWTDILSEEDRVLLMEVANETGEPVFDGALRAALAVKLRESPFLNLVPDEEAREMLATLGSAARREATPGLADEVCQRYGAKAVLQGSLRKTDGNYRITLEAVRCGRGYSLATEEAEADNMNGVLEALAEAASRLRRRLGESRRSLQKYDAPIGQATTRSLPALQFFGLGLTAQEEGKDQESIRSFENAIRSDRAFALAHARLALAYDRLGDSAQARQRKQEAFRLRERATELDRLMISAAYHEDVSGNLDEASETYQRWKVVYRRDWRPRAQQANQYLALGEFEKAVEESRQALGLDPKQALSSVALARAYMGLGRLKEAKAICEQMLADNLESVHAYITLYEIAFVEGDQDRMARQAALAKDLPGEPLMLVAQAEAAAFSGRLRRARDLYEQAAELARRRNSEESAATLTALGALTEAEVGHYRVAQTKAAQAASLGAFARASAVLALARSGEVGRAEMLSDELARRWPEDTLLQAVALPTIRAHIKVHQGQPVAALDLLQAARRYELGMSPEFPRFAAIYVRGQAYMLAGRAAEAADEFQRILDHRSLDPVSPFYALAYFRLARAYSLAGNMARARQAYQDFLALWKDADPDIPILQEAKAEYAKLEKSMASAPAD